MNKQEALKQFEEAAYMSGGIYRQRIMASAKLAIATDPNNWTAVLASLRKWRPEFFSEKEAIYRKRKAQNEMKSGAAVRAAHYESLTHGSNEVREAICLNRSRRFLAAMRKFGNG